LVGRTSEKRELKSLGKDFKRVDELLLKRHRKVLDRKLNMFTDTDGNVVYTDPHLFYQSFGYLTHPFTKQKVEHLAPYQYESWRDIIDYKYNIFIKSNKIGLSTLALMALFQNCMLKDGAGNEKLVIAQTSKMAKEHLYTLRQLILSSETFKNTMIMRPGRYLLRDEATKVTELFIHNPYRPEKPTRVIALGASAASSVSWKNVDFILVSDITKANIDYTEVIDGAFTRLAMTRGKFVIETIPRGPRGKVYSLWQDCLAGKNDFKPHKYPVEMAIQAGLISQEFIDEEKRRLGPYFNEYYGAEFISVGGNVFSEQQIADALEAASVLNQKPLNQSAIWSFPKSMGIDPAFGSDSMFAIVVTQMRNGIIEVIYAEEFTGMDHEKMCNLCINIMHRYNITKCYVDMQMQSVSDKLKLMQNDSTDEKGTKNIPFDQLRLSEYKINPISFGKYGMQMIQHAQRIFSEKYIAIDENRFANLVAQLKTATLVNPSGERPELDKDTYGTMDLFDAFRLSLVNYGFRAVEES
jgi:hypothetical protein